MKPKRSRYRLFGSEIVIRDAGFRLTLLNYATGNMLLRAIMIPVPSNYSIWL